MKEFVIAYSTVKGGVDFIVGSAFVGNEISVELVLGGAVFLLDV
jgi:hypothetical protein